jgi:hypothetical protein
MGFWIERDEVDVRIDVATSDTSPLIAHRFVLVSLLLRLPCVTLLDYFSVGSAVIIFLPLIGIVTTVYLISISRREAARKIDLSARLPFPASFAGLLE